MAGGPDEGEVPEAFSVHRETAAARGLPAGHQEDRGCYWGEVQPVAIVEVSAGRGTSCVRPRLALKRVAYGFTVA